jgi:Rrf2 family protein
MLITRETDYAVRTVLYLARDRDEVASVTEIANAMHIPKSFLAKILQRLVRSGVAESVRGPQGGFRLARRPDEISLLDIMESVQGGAGINVCAVGNRRCRMSAICPVHPVWVEMRRSVEKRLKKQTVAKLLSRTT